MRRPAVIHVALLVAVLSLPACMQGDALQVRTPASQVPQKHQKIAAVGYVWGYLKYHHPYIYEDCASWDAELVAVLRKIEGSDASLTVDTYVATWLDRISPPPEGTYEPGEWISQSHGIALSPRQLSGNKFGVDISATLERMRRDQVPEPQKCAYLGENTSGNVLFDREDPYRDMDYPDEQYRLIALMRYWNMVEYWFPYRELIDEDWDAVLLDSIGQFDSAESGEEYRAALLRLIVRIDDTHASLWTAGDALPPGGWHLSPFTVRNVESKALVAKPLKTKAAVIDTGVLSGDVILAVDGVAVEELVEAWRPYYGASNRSAFLRDTYQNLLRGTGDSLSVTIDRGGESIEVMAPLVSMRDIDLGPTYANDLDGTAFQILDNDIAYLKLSTLEQDKLPEVIDRATKSRGLIIDIRGFPNSFVVFALGQHLVTEPTPFAKFTWPNPHRPGEFHWSLTLEVEPKAPSITAPVVILVDERTQSQSEYTAMAFRASPNAVVIGGQTAGADGNICRIVLPGGQKTTFSGLGVFYPDGSPTQQIGIVPDYEVRPTLVGIRNGKDEVLDAAIELINASSQE